MSDVPENSPAATSPRFPRRGHIPLLALALAAVGILAVQLSLADRVDSGTRRIISFALSLVALGVVLGWFFFASGLGRRVRTGAGVLLLAAAVLLVLSVRRVEFSGDMTPSFDFRWTQDRMAALEEHRTHLNEAHAPPVELSEVSVSAEDVLEYRGPNRDGISPGAPLARDWKQYPPKLVWRQPCGGGYASFLVIGPALVTIEQRRDREAIVAYDAESGRELWVYDYPALFSETLGGDGPRATPTYHEGRIYALGATGQLTALDFASGEEIWTVNILKQNESANLDWGMSGSPLVVGDVVIVNPGDQKGTESSRALAAYSLADGSLKWSAGHGKSSYSSPMLATIGGMRQLVLFDAGGLAGYDPADGRELWRFEWKTNFDINAAQPVILDEQRIVITSETGTALVKVSQADGDWTAEEVWRSRRLKGGYASPIAHDGYLYGIDENILVCLDLADGKLKWKNRDGQYGHGQMLLRDDLLLILGEAGELAIVEASPVKFRELGRIQAIEGKTWNVPVLVGNRVYVRNHLEMAAYELK